VIGVPYQGSHTLFGNWESDNAVDISVPVGTPVYATESGVIGSRIGAFSSGDPHLQGLRVNLQGKNDAFYYAHLSRLAVHAGQRVAKGQLLGYSGSANGVAHLHFASENRDPRSYVGV
jgi:murein DD-endopeptidase MepM/ murein hydrolase activator NlpD